MPSFEKSPVELETLFGEAMAAFPQVTLRKTFGYPCAYINGRMTAGLFANSMFLRLNPQDEAELLGMPGALSFAPMSPTRPMKGYVIIPEDLRSDPSLLNAWILRAIENVGSLPPKVVKTKKRS